MYTQLKMKQKLNHSALKINSIHKNIKNSNKNNYVKISDRDILKDLVTLPTQNRKVSMKSLKYADTDIKMASIMSTQPKINIANINVGSKISNVSNSIRNRLFKNNSQASLPLHELKSTLDDNFQSISIQNFIVIVNK